MHATVPVRLLTCDISSLFIKMLHLEESLQFPCNSAFFFLVSFVAAIYVRQNKGRGASPPAVYNVYTDVIGVIRTVVITSSSKSRYCPRSASCAQCTGGNTDRVKRRQPVCLHYPTCSLCTMTTAIACNITVIILFPEIRVERVAVGL